MPWSLLLVSDLLVGCGIGLVLIGRGRSPSFLTALLSGLLFVAVKAVALGVLLGLADAATPEGYRIVGAGIDAIAGIALAFFHRSVAAGISGLAGSFRLSSGLILTTPFLVATGIGIYDTIPFGGDELMYHMPIAVELLQRGTWTQDLGLSHYWHNDLWQWYPKHAYFVMGYFYSLFGESMVGFQAYGVFAMTFLVFAVMRFLALALRDDGTDDPFWLHLGTILVLSTPVVFLHLFVKVDALLHALLILSIALLLRRMHAAFVLVACFALGFKLTAFVYVGFIASAYALFHARDIWADIRSRSGLSLGGFALAAIAFFALNVSNHVNNWFANGNFLYPLNILHADDGSRWSLAENVSNILPRFFFSDPSNYDAFLHGTGSFSWDRTIYNYDSGLGLAGIVLIGAYVLFLALRAHRLTRTQFFLAAFCVGYALYISLSTPFFLTFRYHIFFLVILGAFVVMTLSRSRFRAVAAGALILWNVLMIAPSVGTYTEAYAGVRQLGIPTTADYCAKIDRLGNIARDDYRVGWRYVCDRVRDSDILLVNQTFNFYLYGKDFSNRLHAPLFAGRDDFARYVRERGIDYVATSNKNNLFSDSGVRDDRFFTTTQDGNDESVLFCDERLRRNVTRIEIDASVERPLDIGTSFGVNGYDRHADLADGTPVTADGTRRSIIRFETPTDVRDTCLTIFDRPTERFDRATKSVRLERVAYVTASGTTLGSPEDYAFQERPMEERWLAALGARRVVETVYPLVIAPGQYDRFTLWKMPDAGTQR